MNTRLDYLKYGPGAIKALHGVEHYLQNCGLEKSLRHLIQLRASQINGCAFCIDMHVEDALADGEHPTRLHLLSVWEETPVFSEREQVAIAWTEAVTQLTEGGPSDELFARAQQQFTEEELVNLNLAVGMINMWNRFAKTFHTQPALKGFKTSTAANSH
ncbi:carboxymuconolactone decarboxylase family protein [Luteolibacter yonseiensis]|uniref:Carboxymuconolactone decarboxylase family protein n=1 Tax=Luteolibacter yonseiensis TaxID=1144680 RepID=A0A934R4X8_9BACT|nr:carboxymuconolactone decarboxylase family protein [Luteolibacter yonseiensis]MBK1817019.1 carboxymuconolactone decarboxylase family protein [Luteolibacter yonseiensis]